MEINQNFLGLINKNNKQNSVLHVVQNYGELLEKKDISENKKKYIQYIPVVFEHTFNCLDISSNSN